jgi:hypothetical protein
MRFLTYDRLAAGDLADKVAKVRAAIERDDFKSPDVKRLQSGPITERSSTMRRGCY